MASDSYEELMMPLHRRFGADVALPPDLPCAVPSQKAPPSASAITMLHATANAALREQLLGHIHTQSPSAFERLIIEVLLKMGYGSRRRDLVRCLGQSHDGGIDGVIEQDELALDLIYIQAKRLRPASTVPISQVRDFVGSLESRHANKGVFATTAQFSSGTVEFVRSISRRVVLVNGQQLADIMIRHNIGVKVKETYQFKELELSYFSALPMRS